MSDTSRNFAIGAGAVVVLADDEVKTTDAGTDTSIAADIGGGTGETGEAPAVAEVPDVEGELLSIAYDELGDAGFHDVEVVPVDRHAVALDYANWKVVDQTPTGSRHTDPEIRLEVVKTDEAESSFCFDGDC